MKGLKGLRGLVILIALLAIAVSTGAATITVPDDYATIQAAIDAAEPGATIVLRPGEYNENLVLTKDLTLQGNGSKVKAADSEKPVVTVLAGVMCLEGLLILGGQHGILIGSTLNPFFPFVPSPLIRFRRSRTWLAPRVAVVDCTIRDNRYNGISVFDTSLVEIIGCGIERNGWYGVNFEDTSRGNISVSTIQGDSSFAISVSKSSRVEIAGCLMLGSGVLSSGHIMISSCQFKSESPYSGSGIKVWEGSHTTVRKSTISGYLVGIDAAYASGGVQLEIFNNTFYANKYGIESSTFSDGVCGADNIMYDNAIDIVGNLPSGLRAPLVVPQEREVQLPDARYPTLQRAVDAMLPGGQLLLEAGEYRGGVTIDKDITIEAIPGARVLLVGGEVGVSVACTAHVTLKGLVVTNAATAVRVGAQSNVELVNCVIRNSESLGALHVEGSSVLSIVGSTIQENNVGLFVQQDGRAMLRQCNIQGNGIGVLGMERAELELTECAVTENESGVTVEDAAKAVIIESVFERNEEEGLFVLNGAEAQLYNVEFKDNSVGIYVGGFAVLTCHDVVLDSNKIGVATWTQECGIYYAYKLFLGWIEGQVRAFGSSEADLCPPYPGYPWPEGFLKEGTTCE